MPQCIDNDALDYVEKLKRLPLADLRHPQGQFLERVRYLDREDIRSLLRNAGREPLIVVASVGEPLRWLTGDDAFEFWKAVAQRRIGVRDGSNYLEDFPGEYFYFASEWCDESRDVSVIVLEHHH